LTDVSEHNVREFFQHADGVLSGEEEVKRWAPENITPRVSSTLTRAVNTAIATVNGVLRELASSR
jgi:ABC-type xylose transport system substrate-binding protein